jgi:hypothetical protein
LYGIGQLGIVLSRTVNPVTRALELIDLASDQILLVEQFACRLLALLVRSDATVEARLAWFEGEIAKAIFTKLHGVLQLHLSNIPEALLVVFITLAEE